MSYDIIETGGGLVALSLAKMFEEAALLAFVGDENGMVSFRPMPLACGRNADKLALGRRSV